jgi:hypothetical protein
VLNGDRESTIRRRADQGKGARTMSSSTAVKKFLLDSGFPVDVVRVREEGSRLSLTVLLADRTSRKTAALVLEAVAEYMQDNGLAGDCDVFVPG